MYYYANVKQSHDPQPCTANQLARGMRLRMCICTCTVYVAFSWGIPFQVYELEFLMLVYFLKIMKLYLSGI